MMVSFEFDSEKSASDLNKHGINFEEAQALWEDPDFIEIQANSDIESRSLVIGRIGGNCWSAIITYRDDNIRIISVRRSRKSEVTLYES